jgi:hypothetical protein
MKEKEQSFYKSQSHSNVCVNQKEMFLANSNEKEQKREREREREKMDEKNKDT